MSDDRAGAPSAGALLRAARERQGLHVAALAAAIKVAPAKLEALEADRFGELLDATFARALAQSVCRVLKIDATPILQRLPASAAPVLEKVDRGLNTPFRDRPGRIVPGDLTPVRHPAAWTVLLLLAAAAAFVLVPGDWLHGWLPRAADGLLPTLDAPAPTAPRAPVTATAVTAPPAGAGAQSPAASAAAPAALRVDDAAAVAAPAPVPVAPAALPPGTQPAADGAAAGTTLHAVQSSWVQVVDGNGRVLLSRLLAAGERIDVTGARPLRVRVGNARGTELVHRGQRVDLLQAARENVATVELP